METVSVVVSFSNEPEEIRQVLESLDGAVAFLQDQPEGSGIAVDVVIVDESSGAAAREALEEFARGRSNYQVLLRGEASNRGCARNRGVSLAAGDVLFFLDGDGVFLENHMHECLCVLRAHPEVDFIKSPILLSDPVHPDWVARIANSLVLNVCVRRPGHERVCGFPDRHIFRREGDRFEHELDIFESVQDVFYNMKLSAVLQGRAVQNATVKYLRRPGNALDRQYERFRSEPGHGRQEVDELYELRLKIARALIDHEIAAIRGVVTPSRPPGV